MSPKFTFPPSVLRIAAAALAVQAVVATVSAGVGVGAKPARGADVLIDGTRKTLDSKWTYWQGPRFSSSLPIKWKVVEDPVDKGTVVMTDDPAAAGGKYGAADIVTKKAYRDFRLHVEFLVNNPGGNSGVYLQNRYEIQIMDGDKTPHGMGAVINETPSPYAQYKGIGKWNAYDINFRAARFKNGQKVEPAQVTMYFNGVKVHVNQRISQVWGGPNSGIDGGNDGGKGVTDVPGGLKLQCEGHDVRYRNVWIKEIDLGDKPTDFNEKYFDRVPAGTRPEKSRVLKTAEARRRGGDSDSSPRFCFRSLRGNEADQPPFRNEPEPRLGRTSTTKAHSVRAAVLSPSRRLFLGHERVTRDPTPHSGAITRRKGSGGAPFSRSTAEWMSAGTCHCQWCQSRRSLEV